MYSLLLWVLRLPCTLSQLDSDAFQVTPSAHKVITPEGFGH
ncbi:hypothetical protein [uncultured Ruegeria sp.]|jgi:hypothetical protein|nr:hypothetical protein [uncultured Ruegeria sp.]